MREREGTTERGNTRDDSMSERRRKKDERERVQVVQQSAVECLFSCCMCSSLVFHTWHASHLSCSSQYSSSVITCLVVLPSPWPQLPPVVTFLFCSTLIRRCMSR